MKKIASLASTLQLRMISFILGKRGLIRNLTILMDTSKHTNIIEFSDEDYHRSSEKENTHSQF